MIEKCRGLCRKIISGAWFIPALCALSAVALCTGTSLIAMAIMVAFTMFIMIFSDDTFAALCSVMIIVMTVTAYYDNYYALLDYAWAAIPFAAAFLIHIFAYRGKFVRGKFFWSLAAVSVSLIVGGVGVIPADEYFSGVSLYYVIGLGAALLLIYMLICSRLSRPRDYDIVGRFAALLYGMALLAALIILLFYVRNWDSIMADFKTPFISYRNFCTTVMLFGMPMCCHFAQKKPQHLLSFAFIYFVMLIGGSRSALFFGTVELLLSVIYVYVRSDAHRRKKYRKIAYFSAIPVMVIGAYLIYTIFVGETGRMADEFIRTTEKRPLLYRQGVIDFLEQPLVGYGIGNMKNAEIYLGVPGSIMFYHNSILQVMGSLGLVGCAAYGYQLFERVRMLWNKRKTDACLLAVPFIGVMMMSQTNPGSFCPLPNALLLVVMFAVAEFENSACSKANTATESNLE